MLFPKPPRPVGPRRAVAEMIVAYRQAAPIAVGHVYRLPPAAAASTGSDDPAPRHPGEPGAPLSPSDHDTPV